VYQENLPGQGRLPYARYRTIPGEKGQDILFDRITLKRRGGIVPLSEPFGMIGDRRCSVQPTSGWIDKEKKAKNPCFRSSQMVQSRASKILDFFSWQGFLPKVSLMTWKIMWG